MSRNCFVIRIYIPINTDSNKTDGVISPVELSLQESPELLGIVDVLNNSAPIGVIQNYKGVYELSLGVEGFTPLEGSNPTLGELNNKQTSPTAILTTYAPLDCDEHLLNDFFTKVSHIHPWETPVIELIGGGKCTLWTSMNNFILPKNQPSYINLSLT